MRVAQGGTVTAGVNFFSTDAAANIGNAAGGTGLVTVSDFTSLVSINGQLNVGNSGTGTLVVQNGGTVTTGNLTASPNAGISIGRSSGGSGNVVVSGTASLLSNFGRFSVGGSDNGTTGGVGSLLIEAGGHVVTSRPVVSNATPSMSIGAAPGSSGSSVVVTGQSSNLAVTGNLIVALNADASLSVLAGARVQADQIVAGTNNGTADVAPTNPNPVVANILLDGAGGAFTTSLSAASITIGDKGAGYVAIRNGAQLTAGSIGTLGTIVIGAQTGADGFIDVTGANSSISADNIVIGGAGRGRVALGAGSTMYGTFTGGGITVGSTGVISMLGGTINPGTTLVLNGRVQGSGLIQTGIANNGIVIAQNGNLAVGGFTGSGRVEIDNAGTLTLSNGFIGSTPLQFDTNNGKLVIGTAGALANGHVSGFRVGDAIDVQAAFPGSNAVVDGVRLTGNTVHLLSGLVEASSFSISGSFQGLYLTPDGSGGTMLQALNSRPLSQSLTLSTDFNNDGMGDLIWQNDDGTPIQWIMNGLTPTAYSNFSSPGPNWHLLLTGDFNGDQQSDMLWRADDGKLEMWFMNGTNLADAAGYNSPGANWNPVLTGDFNGDGISDILAQSDSGDVQIWEMIGSTKLATAVSLGNMAGWRAVATGDFNGDRQSDIVWQDSSGNVRISLMDNGGIASTANLTSPGAAWHVVSSGDFNGDGKSDLLWQNENGDGAIWLMNGPNLMSSATISTLGSAWHIVGTNDVNHDGKSDILWQNDGGTAVVWEMDGFNNNNSAGYGPFGPSPQSFHLLGENGMRFINANGTGTITGTVAPENFDMKSFAAGAHTIANFNPAQDIISFSAGAFANVSAIEAAATTVGGGISIDLGGGSSLLIAGHVKDDLSVFDFHIG